MNNAKDINIIFAVLFVYHLMSELKTFDNLDKPIINPSWNCNRCCELQTNLTFNKYKENSTITLQLLLQYLNYECDCKLNSKTSQQCYLRRICYISKCLCAHLNTNSEVFDNNVRRQLFLTNENVSALTNNSEWLSLLEYYCYPIVCFLFFKNNESKEFIVEEVWKDTANYKKSAHNFKTLIKLPYENFNTRYKNINFVLYSAAKNRIKPYIMLKINLNKYFNCENDSITEIDYTPENFEQMNAEKRDQLNNLDELTLNRKYTRSIVPVLGNIGKLFIAEYNNSINNKPAMKHRFSSVLADSIRSIGETCYSVSVELINCAPSTYNMPEYTLNTVIIIASSIGMYEEKYETNPSCPTPDSVHLDWELRKVQKDYNEIIDEVFNKKEFIVRKEYLDYKVFKVLLKTSINFQNNSFFERKAACYFKVVRVPIQSVILGGSVRHLHCKENITFEILSLLVPDEYQRDIAQNTVYKWHCDDAKEYFCRPFQTTDRYRIIYGPFKPMKTYNFTIEVRTTESNFEIEHPSDYQVVVLTKEPIPELSIRCFLNCGYSVFKANPQDIMHLEVLLNNKRISYTEESSNYTWTYSLKGDTKPVKITDYDIAPNIMILKNNALLDNSVYKFTVAGDLGYAELEFETCSIPKYVSCKISPDVGIKGVTYFNIKCNYKVRYNDLSSVMFEFFDRYTNDDQVGRHLGFSAMGILHRVLLTRDTLIVRTVNIFGAYFEKIINVDLKPAPTNNLPGNLRFRYAELDDYFSRLRLISAYGDLVSTQYPMMFNMTNFLLKQLLKENIEDITSIIMMQNVLYSIIHKESKQFIRQLESKSILHIGEILLHLSEELNNFRIDPHYKSQFLTTTRIKEIVHAMINCSCIVLSSIEHYTFKDTKDDKNLKEGILKVIKTIHNLLSLIGTLILPSIRHFALESTSLMLTMNDRTSKKYKDTFMFRIPKDFFNCVPTSHYYYVQTITFYINPFWWSNGELINTEVIDVKLPIGADCVNKYVHKYFFQFGLNINNFGSALVSGTVKQPDPRRSYEINDLCIAVHRVESEEHSTTFIRFINMNNTSTFRIVILQDERPDYESMLLASKNVTKDSSNFTFYMQEENYQSFFYIGILPGAEGKIGELFNYSFSIFSASCKVWRYNSWMSGKRCFVNTDTDEQKLQCSCSLLTVILAGEVYIPLNLINPFSEIRLLIHIEDNPLIIIVVVIILFQYIILFIWSVKKYKEDRSKSIVLVLPDNDPRDLYCYLVAVFTGSRIQAGTSSNVGIRLFGEEGVSRAHILRSDERNTLEANSDDWFLLFSPHYLGNITNVKLWMDYSGNCPNWYCSKVFVCDMKTYETDTFFIENWFGVMAPDFRLKKMTECATCKETNKLSRIISENVWYSFRDLHVWASIIWGHPRSLVTRHQRVSVAFCGLFVSIAVITVFYSSPHDIETIGHYSISKDTLMHSIIACIIGNIVNFIIQYGFRSSYKFTPSPPNFHEHIDNVNMYHFQRNLSEAEGLRWVKILKEHVKKVIKPLPLIPVQSNENKLIGLTVNVIKMTVIWILLLATIGFSAKTIITHGFHLRKIESSLCLTSSLISILFSIFVSSTVKILINASLLGLAKTRYNLMMTHIIGLKNIRSKLEMKLTDKFEEELEYKRNLDIYHPPKLVRVIQLKVAQEKKAYLVAALFIISYGIRLLIIIIFIRGLNLRDYYIANKSNCKEVETALFCDSFDSEFSMTMNDFFNKIHDVYLPKLFAREWYNSKNLTTEGEHLHETGWLKRGVRRLTGPPRLRQIRIKDSHSCAVPDVLSNIFKCSPRLSAMLEDKRNYSTGWSDDDWSDSLFDESPWVYRSPEEAKGRSVQTPSDYSCHGGGYVASLHHTLAQSRVVISNLNETSWIDHRTRILILEFSTYNTNDDIFTTAMFIIDSNNVIPERGYNIASVRFKNITYSGGIFICYLLIITLRLGVQINTIGLKTYFGSFWNIEDSITIFCYVITVVKYLEYIMMLNEVEEIFQKLGKEYFLHIEALTVEFLHLRNIAGVLFSLTAFRMLRLTRFNDNVNHYIKIMFASRKEMFWIWMVMIMFIIIYWRFIMYLLAPPPEFSLVELLMYQNAANLYQKYNHEKGQFYAFMLSFISTSALFSNLISFHNYYKEVQKERTNRSSTFRSRDWTSTFE